MDTSSLMSGEGKPPAASRSRPAPFLDSTTPSKPLKTPIIRGFSNWRDPTAPAEVLPLDAKPAGGRLWLSVCLFGTTHWLTSELTADASAGERLCLTRWSRVITDDSKAWVVHLACSKPRNLGYAAELWTRSALAGHVRREAVAAGFPALVNAGKATVQRILAAQGLQPHQIRYYLERRDPDFETRMREVLLVYKEVAMENEAAAESGGRPGVVTVSVDEKPGVQAIRQYRGGLAARPGRIPHLRSRS